MITLIQESYFFASAIFFLHLSVMYEKESKQLLPGSLLLPNCVTLSKKKSTICQVTTMLATSKNVLFPGHNHLLTTGTHDATLLIIAQVPASEGSSVLVVSWWL